MSCVNTNCKLCNNLIISTGTSIVTVGTVPTLVIDIPAASYANGRKICLVIAQTLPAATTLTTPVAISIGGDTTTVYPLVNCNNIQVTASDVKTRRKYTLNVVTSATSGIFRSCRNLGVAATSVLASLPAPAATDAGT